MRSCLLSRLGNTIDSSMLFLIEPPDNRASKSDFVEEVARISNRFSNMLLLVLAQYVSKTPLFSMHFKSDQGLKMP